jgi:acyl-CoA synthetase (AMP-forming)/AMP-acid ligase II
MPEGLLTDVAFADLPALGRRRFGDRPFVSDDHTTISYHDFDRRTDRLAGGLRAAGLRPGDTVALWMTNRVEWVVAQFAVYKAGGLVAPVNPQYQADELAHILADSRAAMLIYEPRFLGRFDGRGVLTEAIGRRGDEFALRTVIAVGEPADGELGYDAVAAGDPIGAGGGRPPRAAVNVLYTSGTTGRPKGVLLSAYGLLTTYGTVAEYAGLTAAPSRWLLSVPLSTMFGSVAVLLPCLLTGGSLTVRPRFDADDAWAAIESDGLTHLAGSPTMYGLLLDRGAAARSTVRGGIIAGAVAPPALVRTLIEDAGIAELVNMFGQTEGCGTASMTRPGDPMEKRLHTVGRPLPHIDLAIGALDGSGRCPPGAAGEVIARGRRPGVHTFLGYHNLPDRTAEVVDRDGWLHYGDIGTLDADGYLSVGAGRLREMYVSGGYNVYPPEVEDIVSSHPDVARVAVFGVPDSRFGEAGVAYVERRDGSVLTPDELRDWCRRHIAHYKVPRDFVFGADFPLTASGKVKRMELRRRWLVTDGEP